MFTGKENAQESVEIFNNYMIETATKHLGMEADQPVSVKYWYDNPKVIEALKDLKRVRSEHKKHNTSATSAGSPAEAPSQLYYKTG